MATPLPKSRTFITSLISSLPNPTSSSSKEEPSRNPLRTLTENQRAILMTLHVLFPNELLPALDLLDRELVTRYKIQDSSPATTNPVANPTRDDPKAETAAAEAANQNGDENAAAAAIYYVRSAQSTSNNSNSKRYRDPVATSTHYEVRPLAWSCSCPAFSFAAFPSTSPHQQSHHQPRQQSSDQSHQPPHSHAHTEAEFDEKHSSSIVGGLSAGQAMPICKHLLAVTLVEQTGLFKGFATEREIGFEEMVGWAAGWGG